jgi:hypothetical protein
MAVVGYVDEMDRQIVTGWAADLDRPDAAVEIVIFVNGIRYANAVPSIYRDNLKRKLQEEVANPELRSLVSGNYGFQVKLTPSLSVFEECRIEVRAGSAGPVLPNGTKTLRSPPVQRTGFLPILVNGIGRSGTTLLMQKLSLHPEIVVAPLYPYEITLSAYYAAAFRTLISGQDREKSSDPDTLFSQENQYWIGFNPFNRPGLYHAAGQPGLIEKVFEEFVPARLAETFRSIIEEYYNVLRRDQGRPSARYFAEKSNLDEAARKAPRVFFGSVREIILIRDPRDLLCSAKSFWKKSSTDAMTVLSAATSQLMRMQGASSPEMLFVKYEDLVIDVSNSMNRIYEFLGLTTTGIADADGEAQLFKSHATSSSPKSSIGRWKTDLTEQEIEVSSKTFREFLEKFGYKN